MLEDSLLPRIKGEVNSQSQVMGRVEIREGAKMENSVLRGPFSIAERCRINNSLIGPFTSIAAGATIEHSYIEHSVILQNCSISNIERLEGSVIGRRTEVIGRGHDFKAVRLFVGDDAKVELWPGQAWKR